MYSYVFSYEATKNYPYYVSCNMRSKEFVNLSVNSYNKIVLEIIPLYFFLCCFIFLLTSLYLSIYNLKKP